MATEILRLGRESIEQGGQCQGTEALKAEVASACQGTEALKAKMARQCLGIEALKALVANMSQITKAL